ncbi:N2 N2-dimethylguanosine tRNA methyltransferase, partial [Cantharellus anzutake]|uniref:N2 N2-dimethylguanosine tRNA methyltransferase n=1 Tax=Cantharellus anzutake TaxID=1750568 RepID=UPI001908D098
MSSTQISTSSITVPEDHTLHRENSAFILLPSENGAFLNPVQEFNRDLSVACIRVWSERNNREQERLWDLRRDRQEAKVGARDAKRRKAGKNNGIYHKTHKITILEPLSATGLRSIRYANEIPLVNYVIANDLSPEATAVMRRNVDINGLGKVRVHEGDACTLMYNHREERQRVDVIDLDPYGTAAPFMDAAVQAVADGGLLCVTCTDLAVLAGQNYPEKCFSNYGGIPVKSEYTHEAALRLVINSVANAAARYGRSITPLLSLSIDFYVRLFFKIRSSPSDVKRLASKTAIYFVCTSCQAFHEQPLGKAVEKISESSGQINIMYKTTIGPTVGTECGECGSKMHVAGPMWSGPLHDNDFVEEVLRLVKENPNAFGTSSRMQGMLTVASEELESSFYFTPSKMAGNFHCSSPSMQDAGSALLNAGHKISRSHALPGSIKTNASRKEIHDVIRSWIKLHPVKMSNIKEGSPAFALLSKEPTSIADFTRHPGAVDSSSVKLVRYQQNPTPNWGPGSRAGGKASKRKR